MEQESRTDREMVGNGNAAPLPGDGALCESLAQLSVSGEGAIDDEDLLSKIRLFECPDRAVVAARAIKMGLRMSRAVEQAIGASCKFERKGSLFDDKLCHVSDVDLLMYCADRAPAAVLRAALASEPHLVPFEVKVRFADGEETEFAATSLPLEAYREDAIVVVATCAAKFETDLLPLDLTATSLEQRDESVLHRVAKIGENVEEGKFDKALQRLRPLVRRLRKNNPRSTQALRAELTEAMNSETGQVRFASKQLALSAAIGRTTPAVARCGISSTAVGRAAQLAKEVNACAARRVLARFAPDVMKVAGRSAVAPALRNSLERCAVAASA